MVVALLVDVVLDAFAVVVVLETFAVVLEVFAVVVDVLEVVDDDDEDCAVVVVEPPLPEYTLYKGMVSMDFGRGLRLARTPHSRPQGQLR